MAEDRIYLSVGPDHRNAGKYIAVISRGSPVVGDTHVLVLSANRVDSIEDAQTWFEQMLIEQPWETRQ